MSIGSLYTNSKLARMRLTLSYLAVIMGISIAFSFVLYHVSTNEASSNLSRQAGQLRDLRYIGNSRTIQNTLSQIRAAQLKSFQHKIQLELLGINMIMLVFGAIVSYYLAERNLRPLEDALNMQTRFTSDAAHELRTPLTALRAENEVALRDKNLKIGEARELLESNLEEIGKLEALTNALLRLTKNGGSPDKTLWKVYDVHELMDEVMKRQKQALKARNMTFDTAALGKQYIRGDRDQLVQLFGVLVENAIKYGRDSTTVTLASAVRDGKLAVSVADQGLGIAADDLPNIFDRFFRADQSRTGAPKTHGYGLGLSLAKLIVEAHDGEIRATSQLGVGSTFTVVVPAVKS